jgi:putative membrane protein
MTGHSQQFTFEWTVIALSAAALFTYLLCVSRVRIRSRDWNMWRTASFAAGVGLLVAALLPPVAGFAHQDLRGHMAQHLALGMFGPLLLVLGAPMSLLLRCIRPIPARMLVRFLHSSAVSVLSHPVTTLFLNVGGMYLLYLTPLYARSLSDPVLHAWVHLHFIVAGYLFTWSIAGPDPGPHRPSPRVRLAVLFISIATHAILAKAMYAYGWPRGSGHSLSEIQAAAKLMYYGGDFAELLLLIALLLTFFPALARSAGAAGGQTPKGVA